MRQRSNAGQGSSGGDK
jgi:hypothetical protein